MNILITQKNKVYSVTNDVVTLHAQANFKMMAEPLIITDYNDAKQIIEHAKPSNLSIAEAIEIKKKHIAEKRENAKARLAAIEANLSDFWKDVDSRSGMDVCTPFLNKFPNDSFVAYSEGFVWSKSQRTVYNLKTFTGSSRVYPSATSRVIKFGEDHPSLS